MWDTGDAVPYLTGLLVLAIAVALLRTLLFIVMHYAAAVATIEAATRCAAPSTTTPSAWARWPSAPWDPARRSASSRATSRRSTTRLYAWLTVCFREPVKFGLLLAFALVVNFWLALAFLLFALLVWLIGGQIAAYFRDQGRLATQRGRRAS